MNIECINTLVSTRIFVDDKQVCKYNKITKRIHFYKEYIPYDIVKECLLLIEKFKNNA